MKFRSEPQHEASAALRAAYRREARIWRAIETAAGLAAWAVLGALVACSAVILGAA